MITTEDGYAFMKTEHLQKSTHKVRKTYISTLISNGVNINLVRKQAGHKHETTTLKNYTFDINTVEESEVRLEKALVKSTQPPMSQN